MSVLNYSGSSCCSVLSDNSESSLEDTSPSQFSTIQLQRTDDICRDFLRNVCKRGAHCRYRHPAGTSGNGQISLATMKPNSEPVFCHDFQNLSGCQRPKCRFIHCTRDQEEEWKKTGRLPQSSFDPAIGSSINNNNVPDANDVIIPNHPLPPICLDFLKTECKRAEKCKYRHLSSAEYEAEVLVDQKSALQMAAIEAAAIFEETGALKRRRISDSGNGNDIYVGSDYYENVSDRLYHRSPRPTAVVSLSDYQQLEEDNRFLRHKVDDLKRHISVLLATNELLLDQNARYRSTMMAVPPPSIGQVATPTITPAVRHHAGPHGITTMATLGHITINGQREILMQPAPTLVHHSQQTGGLTLVHQRQQPAGVMAGGTGAGSVVDASSSVSMAIVPMTIPLDGAITRQSLISIDGANIDMNMAAAAAMSMPNLVISGPNIVTMSTCGGHNMGSMSGPISIMAPLSIGNLAFGGISGNIGPANMAISVMGQPNMVQSLSGPHMSSVSMPQAPPPSMSGMNLQPQTTANLMSYPIMSHAQLPSSSLV